MRPVSGRLHVKNGKITTVVIHTEHTKKNIKTFFSIIPDNVVRYGLDLSFWKVQIQIYRNIYLCRIQLKKLIAGNLCSLNLIPLKYYRVNYKCRYLK